MGELLGDLVRGACDLLWPRACFACGAPLGGTREPWLCARCRAVIPALSADLEACPRCAALLGPAGLPVSCTDCARLRPRFDGVRAAGPYAGPLRRLVVAMKYAGRSDGAWPLGELMAAALDGRAGVDLVVPFPTTAAARRRRGFDPPALLAAEVARRCGLPLETGVLVRTGNPPPQASLSRAGRLDAPRGTVAAARGGVVAGRRVLLVDDVLTTGASASEAARALRRAGALGVMVVVAARA